MHFTSSLFSFLALGLLATAIPVPGMNQISVTTESIFNNNNVDSPVQSTESVERRDGSTEFDADLAFFKERSASSLPIEKRDGSTEFDADLAFFKERSDSSLSVKKRDGTTEFDADLGFFKERAIAE